MRERGLAPPVMAVREGAVVVTFGLPAKASTPVKAGTREKTREKTPEKTDAAILRLLREQSELSMWIWPRDRAGSPAASSAQSGNCATPANSNASALTRAATGR